MTDKLTNNTGEATLDALFNSSHIFEVPFFQRPYKWKPAKVQGLIEDLERLTNSDDDLHFMGALIVHGSPSSPTEAKSYQVIDGQQRLTTVYLLLLALVRTLIENNEFEKAKALFHSFMITSKDTGGRSNLTLHPSGQDRADLNHLVREVLGIKNFGSMIEGFTFKPLPEGSAPRSDRVTKNFKIALKYFKEQFVSTDDGPGRMEELYTCLLQRMTVVQIDVRDPLSGPKIFDSLNSQQEPMTIGDLVRNDIFSRAITANLEVLNEELWQPFFSRFGEPKDGRFDNYFFPFGLYKDPSMKKANVYSSLRKIWIENGIGPHEIIAELSEIQDDYMQIATGRNLCGHSKKISDGFYRLYQLGAPTSIYPFTMHLSHAIRVEELDDSNAIQILDGIESFLVRRAVCGIEPTGLHAVFKGLWQELMNRQSISVEAMIEKIVAKQTVSWPSPDDFARKIQERPLYGSRVAQFLLREYDDSLPGDGPGLSAFEIEHVLPRNPAEGDWSEFTSEQHLHLRDTWANLIPLTSEMNNDLKNGPYANKRPTYLEGSQFSSARKLAQEFTTWTPECLEVRAQQLTEWALTRWKY